MTNISASMVKELREMTGVGMMDCKKALAETSGDIEAGLPRKGLPWRNRAWAYCTERAKVCPRTMAKRRSGFAGRPSRAFQWRNTIWP